MELVEAWSGKRRNLGNQENRKGSNQGKVEELKEPWELRETRGTSWNRREHGNRRNQEKLGKPGEPREPGNLRN